VPKYRVNSQVVAPTYGGLVVSTTPQWTVCVHKVCEPCALVIIFNDLQNALAWHGLSHLGDLSQSYKDKTPMDINQNPMSHPDVLQSEGMKTVIPQTRDSSSTSKQESTVTFVDGGTQVVSTPKTDSISTQGLDSGCYMLDNQNLVDFFAKPFVLSSISWTTDVPLTSLLDVLVPSDVIAASDVMLNRIQFWRGFRGDIVFDVEVNPAQSQSGKLLCVFQPFTRISPNRYNTRWYSLYSLTQMPKMEIDLATDTGGELTIPFRMPCAYYPVQNVFDSTAIEDYGTFSITPYSPLRGGGSLTITTRVYFRPETVKLVNPTTRPLEPPVELHAGVKSNIRKRDVEKSVGPVSSVLNAVSKVASGLTAVPLLADVFGPVSWVTAAAAGAASMLGFSNPRQERPPKLFISRNARDLCTVDQSLPAYVYAFTGASCLGPVPPGGLTDEDEMHFGHLLPLSACSETTAVWTTSSAVNTALLASRVPFDFGRDVTTRGPTDYTVHYTPWRAIACLFDQYHFSLILKIKIAKSRFHTGKLLVVFETDQDADAPDIETANPAWTVLIDISQGNEWAIKLPYSNQNHYSNYDENYGRVYVLVQNQLQTAGGASSSVDVIYETSVDIDASFGYPTDQSHWLTAGTLPSGQTKPSSALVTLGQNIDPLSFESACQGDTCHSLRTYLKRGIEQTETTADVKISFPVNVPSGVISYDSLASATLLNPVLHWVNGWYGLYRGTMNYSLLLGSVAPCYISLPTKLDATSPPTDLIEYMQWIPANVFVDLQVPQMALNPWRYTVGYGDTSCPNNQQFYVPWLSAVFNNANTRSRLITSLADDFSFSYFVGIEPLPTSSAPLDSMRHGLLAPRNPITKRSSRKRRGGTSRTTISMI
jgi:hypothetical protein